MKMKVYFNKPTQVKFWDYDNGEYVGGIAYKDEIICGCCGSIFSLAEVCEYAEQDGKTAIIEYDYWVNLSEEIIGD